MNKVEFPHSQIAAQVALSLTLGYATSQLLSVVTGCYLRSVQRALERARVIGLLTYQQSWAERTRLRIWCITDLELWLTIVVPRARLILKRVDERRTQTTAA